MIKKLGLAALAAGMLAGPALAAEKLTVETSKGCSFDITLRPDLAPPPSGRARLAHAPGRNTRRPGPAPQRRQARRSAMPS